MAIQIMFKDCVLLHYRGACRVISFNWVITLPRHLTADQFDAWYVGIHTELAKVAHKIVRYSINRRVASQPAAAPAIRASSRSRPFVTFRKVDATSTKMVPAQASR